MGRIKQGILGGFSGKVGTVVGGSWKGIPYMRALAQSIHNPRTVAQMSQRTKFALAVRMLKPVTALLRTGWKLYANGKSAINAAMAYTLANAITGSYPDYDIDPSRLLLSRGTLTPAADAAVEFQDGNVLFTWSDNSGVNSATQSDLALVAILNATRGEAITTTEDAERMDEGQSVSLPAHWEGDALHAYLGFISEDGRDVASSIYLGTLQV